MARSLNIKFFLVGVFTTTLCFIGCIWWSSLKLPFNRNWEGFLWGIPLGLFVATNATIAITALHISTFKISKYHTLSSVITQYVFSRIQWFLSRRGKRQMERYWREPEKEQNRLLAMKLKHDTETEYGKTYHFSKITSMDEYRRRHPLTKYFHYKSYLESLAKGQNNVLTKESPRRFALTSGITGDPKLIPIMPSRANIALQTGMFLNSIITKHFKKFSPLQKWMTSYTAPRPLWTSAGMLVGPKNMYTEQQSRFLGIYNSPVASFYILNDFASHYTHLLLGLRDPDIAVWITSSTSHLKKSLLILESNWAPLLDDLAAGTLNKDLAVPEEIRQEIEALCSPEPDRANQLRKEFKAGFDGIVARIWPKISHIAAVDTEGIKEQLQNSYAKGTPIYSAAYTATEAEIGLNLWPDEPVSTFVLLPNSAIFEFIPEENILEEQPKTCLLNEVERGKSYEIVLSQSGGLCRYRLGDVVKVVQHHLNTPVIEFQYRTEQLLNLANERMTEIDVKTALQETLHKWGNADMVNWVYADSSLLVKDVKPPLSPDGEQLEPYQEIKQARDMIKRDSSELFYLFFIELKGDKRIELTDKQKQQVDNVLQKQCENYRARRESSKVAFPHIAIVPKGTFYNLEDYIITNTAASYNQYKIGRKVRSPYVLRFLAASAENDAAK